MDSRTHPTRVHVQRQQPTSNNTQSHHDRVELIKRKKSSLKGKISETQRTENKAPAASRTLKEVSKPALRPSSTRVFAAMERPPSEPDLLVRVLTNDKGMTEGSSKQPRDTRGRHNDVYEADRQHGNIPVDRDMFTDPLAVAEYERMKKEIETLKQDLHESRKTCKRHAKQLEESKAEANAAVMAMQKKEIELVDVKTKFHKNDELLSTIEGYIQCQICMDLPDKPFALNPCGHVLCLPCLQEWFRRAPPALDEMDVDPDELTNPQYILTRSKTCPSCRAVVKHRPVPIFMIKSVVTVLKKTKLPHTTSPGSRHNDDYIYMAEDNNPWKGIFASSEEEEEEDADADESQVESDSDGLSHWHRHAAAVGDNATSESEMENEEDEEDDDGDLYTKQRWAPPTVSVTDYREDDVPNTVKLLQRGCSRDMLQSFDVSYSHDSGIVVALRFLDHLYPLDDDEEEDADDIAMHRVFLGWNIALKPGDTDGEDYLYEILTEIKDVPERWQMTPTPGVPSSIDVRRLVVVDEAEEFDTTDTEAWIDNEDL